GRYDSEMVKPSLAKFYRHRDKVVLVRGQVVRNEEIIVQSDGSERLFETTKTPIYNIEGNPFAVLGVAHDITDSRAIESELRLAAKILESNIPMVITDSSQKILRVNNALLKLTGYDENELIGQSPEILHCEENSEAFYQQILKTLEQSGHWQGETLGRRKNGEIYPKWLVIAAVPDSIGNIAHYVATEQDLSEQRENMATIERLSFFDSVTELPNRRLMMEQLAKTIRFVNQQGCQGAILHLDLDDFKIINDSYGHLYGDIVLKEIARRLKSCIDVTDTLSRTGGDEFVIILSQLSLNDAGAIEADEIAKRIQDVLSRPFFLEEPETHRQFQYFCSVSIGIALFSTAEVSADELLKHSDIALYNAKTNGRGLIKYFNPTMQDLIITHSEILEDLHKAVNQNQFFVQYQPQVNEMGKVIGAEALVRWYHPELGIIPPNQFIPVAEESGLIVQIGQFVFESVCKQLSLWKNDTQFSDITIAVNVSAQQMKLPNLISGVKSILSKTGAAANQIKLELTESMLLTNTDQIIGIMEELRKTGLKFSLDDFGTGYSSLSYLNRLPIDQIKIDQSFVANLMHHQKNQAIAQTIIQLGQNLGLSILAEGVELPAQLDFLVSHGCRSFQGYLFSKPLDLNQFEDFIRKNGN
ncbi:MAG: EAL domain-containing protein, partial [Leptonema sp. (in: Bacteria)]|nr:EAL domain-containing protein [Leptonema sp. (in: bacteria)]